LAGAGAESMVQSIILSKLQCLLIIINNSIVLTGNTILVAVVDTKINTRNLRTRT